MRSLQGAARAEPPPVGLPAFRGGALNPWTKSNAPGMPSVDYQVSWSGTVPAVPVSPAYASVF